MNKNSLLSIVVLTVAAAIANLSWAAERTVSVQEKFGQPCQLGNTEEDNGANERWMINAALSFAGGCSDCTLQDEFDQFYCESRGTDCDGIWGINESYYWKRHKTVYLCGTPGQPGYGNYVECTTWAVFDCCDDGTVGQPSNNCANAGQSLCSAREPD